MNQHSFDKNLLAIMQTNDILELADSLDVDGLVWDNAATDQPIRTLRSIEMLDLAAELKINGFSLADVTKGIVA